MKPWLSVLAAAAALAIANTAQAQLQPHRAEYSLRLGTAANAPRIGNAVQELTLDCKGWHIRREVSVEAALTPSLKIKVSSQLTGNEDLAGDAFRYQTVVVQNGAERGTRGSVRRDGDTVRTRVETPDGTEEATLPPATLMPLAAVGRLLEGFAGGKSTFPVVTFAAEGAGEALRFDVKLIGPKALPSTPPAEKQLVVPSARSWPAAMAVTRAGAEAQKPFMSVRAQVFESGVLDRLVIDAGIVTVTAYLQSLQMSEMPDCPGR